MPKLDIVRRCIFKTHTEFDRCLMYLQSGQCGVFQGTKTPFVRIGDIVDLGDKMEYEKIFKEYNISGKK